MSGRWSVELRSIAGAAVIVQVYRLDGSIPTLEGSSKLRAVGASSTPVSLFAGMSYEAHFIPYGKGGTSTLIEHFMTNQPPIASFTYSPSNPNAGQSVSFDASGSSDPDGQIVSYDWAFGDGSTGSGVSTRHAYTSGGVYTVSLRVTDDFQAYSTENQSITVSQNQPPTAAFTYSPASPRVGDLVSFDGSGSSDSDGTIVSISISGSTQPTS